ncbi:kinase D-interacting substrate of 220 kDa B isoform X1 [Bombus bifarius]|uniref:Kinase D-interacting substrate of 220 kDa B isoform X1 n=2 Tax=Bombus bifarius TaxID=103933 RepID=A0A6P8N3H7_9HYME|nr:kinase D-interacting substrate of 220 kDa B isoform X1 [Bombus vancouverensis nearcticus]XP_033320746.1 kinase D-interacting substrate of 220 kDa B isoform X1 [Bombus bifarius]
MRKAKDDRVKIATHHFRISIEEEGDEENKEAEDAARETDRRFSITIEADSGIVVASQESQAQDLAINREERSFANDQTANEILSEEFVERTWNEQEKKAQSFESKSSKNSGDSKGRSSKGSVGQQQILLEKFVDRTLNEQGREVRGFEFKTSKDSDGSDSGPSQEIGSRESISQKKRIDKFANGKNLSGDSQNCGKIEKTQSDNWESETRFSVASSEIPNENYEISASGSSPRSISADQNFGVLCSKFKYIINESSYENVDLTKKLERGSTSSFLPFETSNPSELKRHRSLSSYETYKSSNLNTSMQRKRSLQDPTGVTLQNLRLLDQPREKAQSVTAAEIQETSQILTHPNIESIKAVPPSAVSVSPLLIRRYYKVMSAFSNNSSSLENTYPSKMLEDPLQTRQDSIKTPKNDVNCTNSEEGGNQRNTQRRLTLPAINIDLDSGEKSGTANYQNVLSGTSVNPIRRSSIANAAICSSLAPSLASAYPGVPNCLLPTSNGNELSNISSISEQIPERSGVTGLKMKLPFLRLHIPGSQPISGEEEGEEEDPNHHSHHHHHHHHHHHVFPYFHVPTFTFTAPATDGEPGRKFNFGIRRHSQTTLHRTDSMVSLCYRSLASYITDDNLAGLQSFLENKRVLIDDRDENGSTALILAATKGKIHFVRELINHGADVNAEDADNWTALLCAAKEGHTDVCLELLEHGADLEHRDMGGWTALMWATYKGRSPTVMMLLGREADVNAHGNFHISSLLWAAGRGYPDIVKDLIAHGAKVNVGDKYGTTALVWASRKGHVEIVDTLLKAGANVDTAGMYSWTALLVATLGNHLEVVLLLLEHKPNVNALDKDGCTALAIACREGHHEIANALLNAGAYVNIQDRAGDTNLIHAVKGGHRGVVESLLKKYADVDIAGKDKKTATYIAVEKGNISILKLLLNANPDLEIATKDGDTPLLRAVRSRNAEIVQILLDKKAKVSATDKKGDTVLHIAMRARSKAIVEILLRNPKNSQLLYRPNRQGETPYNIDINHPKTILGQIFGARRLNTNEDNENMLGYDLYSSALADILSEPSLSTPITVGLYAKWGSGKSFLLNKLREEMKNFARQWMDPVFQFSVLLFVVVTHVSLLVGITIGLALQSWIVGLACGISLIFFTYTFLILVWYANKRYDWYWPYNFTVALTTKLNSLKLLLQVIFCHPPGGRVHDDITVQPIKFYFTDQTRVGTTAAGENAVVQMVGSLYDSIENEFGSLSTRLYRAFRPKPDKSTTTWKWRHLCCLPYIVIFEFCFCSLLVGISVLTVYLIDISSSEPTIERVTSHIIMITVALILAVSVIANLYTWSRTLQALVFSQRRHLQRSISKLETLKSEGFIQTLRSEVSLMTEMVKCLDSFMAQQSRLVIIVDGLDSCEQDKVLLVLDAIQALFSDNGYPFVVILAIDPHIIAKAVEVNSRRLFTESNIGGHDYLRNMVHLPFYLQNSGLRKVKVAQQTAQHSRKTTWTEAEESVNYTATSTMHHSVSNRRLSTESAIMNSNEKLKPQSRKGSRKLRLSESIASSIGSNLNRLGGAQDLNKMLLTDDYFSDVNPRSMRRLMNVVYVTGRLLKAFQIDFNWYHLASWINITEQWPFRTSWLILHYDMYEDSLDDSMSLKSLYDKIRPQIPVLKEVQPLLEMDRDERKLDIFLTFHRSSLLVSDMKIFLPFTINLDPYIKKKIKEEQQSMEEESGLLGPYKQYSPWTLPSNTHESWSVNKSGLSNRTMKLVKTPSLQGHVPVPSTSWVQPCMQPTFDWQTTPSWQVLPMEPAVKPLSATTTLPSEILEIRLSSLTVNGICDLIDRIDSISPNQAPQYKQVIKENNINGRVLLHCDLQELKKVLKMAFGDWELFRMVIVSLRELEVSSFSTQEEGSRSVRFTVGSEQIQRKGGDHALQNTSIRVPTHVEKDKGTSRTDGPRRDQTKQSIMEKQFQVTLEEQMICGALQTLNEEACEDVLDVPSSAVVPSDSLAGSISMAPQDTDYVILQSNPLLHWVPVNDEPETSDDSSFESTVHLQRTNSQRSITSQLSTRSACSFGRKELRKSGGNSISSRPASLFVSPPPSPRPAFRSKSTDEYYVANNIPMKSAISTPMKKRCSTSTLNDELILSVPVPNSSLEKLSKLKDRLMGTLPVSPAPGESEDESTPLVSELSTPTHSQSDSVFKHDCSEENSSSISSNKSLPRDGERSIDVVDYSDTVSLMVREASQVRFLSRQDAEEWDNPETPV